MCRIELTRAFKQLSREISQMYLHATKVDDGVFIRRDDVDGFTEYG